MCCCCCCCFFSYIYIFPFNTRASVVESFLGAGVSVTVDVIRYVLDIAESPNLRGWRIRNRHENFFSLLLLLFVSYIIYSVTLHDSLSFSLIITGSLTKLICFFISIFVRYPAGVIVCALRAPPRDYIPDFDARRRWHQRRRPASFSSDLAAAPINQVSPRGDCAKCADSDERSAHDHHTIFCI